MTITTDHPRSKNGVPVIISDNGLKMHYAVGVKAIRMGLGLSVPEFATLCRVSPKTVYHWQSTRIPPAGKLNIMADALRKAGK